MAAAKGAKNSASGPGGETSRRGTRRRTLLNLGIPFVPVDDFLNQAEDAVALGYRVLEDVVEEIKKGYNIAVEYNKKKMDADQTGDPAPPIPWQQLVERVEGFNDIALGAMQRGNRIVLDSLAAGVNSTNSLARTLAKTRIDAEEQRPKLAGPVFDDLLTVSFQQGQADAKAEWPIDHPGLTRLRIHAQVSPLLELGPVRAPDKGVTRVNRVTPTLPVAEVSFEPAASPNHQKTSLLKIKFGRIPDTQVAGTDQGGRIPDTQVAGTYQGQVTAANFDLLIARLQVVVSPSKTTSQARQARKARPRGSSRR